MIRSSPWLSHLRRQVRSFPGGINYHFPHTLRRRRPNRRPKSLATMGHEDDFPRGSRHCCIRMAFVYGSFVRRRRKEERRGNVGRQRPESPWSVMRTRDIRRQPPMWKAAIGTGNSFVVAEADASAMASPVCSNIVTALTSRR